MPGIQFVLVDNPHGAIGPHHGNLGGWIGKIDIGPNVLAAHHVVGASVCFSCDHGNFRDGGFRECVKQFGPVTDDTSKLLNRTGQESGHIHESDQRNVKGIAEADKTGCFYRRVDIQDTGQIGGLVGHDAHAASTHAGKTNEDVWRVTGLNLKKVLVIDHRGDQLMHVVGFVGIGGNQLIQLRLFAVALVECRNKWRIFHVVGGKVAEKLTDHQHRMLIVIGGEVGNPAFASMGDRAAKLFLGHLLVRHLFDHIGSGYEHVAGLFHHDDEIGDGRRIDSTTRAGTQNGRDLWNDTRTHHVAVENIGISGQTLNPFLDPRPARVVQSDDRRSHVHGQIHDLDYFIRVGAAHGAPKNSEILGKNIDQPAVNLAISCYYPVAGDD